MPIRLFLIVLLLCGCGDNAAETVVADEPFVFVTGKLENRNLDEASGLARSHRAPGIFWAINDDGGAYVYALDETGKHLGKVRVKGASNRDWEDLASFVIDDQPYLLIADIGDNGAKHKKSTFYVINEPKPSKKKVEVAWRVDFRYPEGPRDAEAIAVDTISERVMVLTKRDIPAVLYELPLRGTDAGVVAAKLTGPVDTLPQPTKLDVNNAVKLKDWYWQPTGMDISGDNSFAVVLTYAGVYYYTRKPEEAWITAFGRRPLGASLGGLQNAEAVVVGIASDDAYVTIEKKHAPIVRFDLKRVQSQ